MKRNASQSDMNTNASQSDMNTNASQSDMNTNLSYNNEESERIKDTLFSEPIQDQPGNDEFNSWLDNSLPLYGLLIYLKVEVCDRTNTDEVNVKETKRRAKLIFHHRDRIIKLCEAFIKLKKLKTKYNDNNNLINKHYDIWFNFFMCLQTGDVLPLDFIKDEKNTAIIHQIFRGHDIKSLEQSLHEMKGNKRQRHMGGMYMRVDTTGKKIKSKKNKRKQIKSKQIKSKKIKSKQIKSKKNKRKQIKSKQIKSKKNKGLQIKNKQSKKNKKNFK